MSRTRAPGAPQLLTVAAAAELLNVSHRTVLNWIKRGDIPYIELPGGGKASYRIPMHALLATLRGNYNLADAMVEQPEEAPAPAPVEYAGGGRSR
jgi:excisionase family DNA binding protein